MAIKNFVTRPSVDGQLWRFEVDGFLHFAFAASMVAEASTFLKEFSDGLDLLCIYLCVHCFPYHCQQHHVDPGECSWMADKVTRFIIYFLTVPCVPIGILCSPAQPPSSLVTTVAALLLMSISLSLWSVTFSIGNQGQCKALCNSLCVLFTTWFAMFFHFY